eukprot:m51a1_g1952 hypothetical protein (130) ;mRNA; r:1013411-1014550
MSSRRTRVFRTAKFEVRVTMQAAWLASNAVAPENVWESGRRAVLLNCCEDRPVEPCPRCCVPVGRPNVTIEWCNSSRLHLGGKVVLLLEIANARGAVVSRLHSDRLQLCSKTAAVRAPIESSVGEPAHY